MGLCKKRNYDYFNYSYGLYFTSLCRDAIPAHGKTTDVIREAILSTKNVGIDLKSIKSLKQVNRKLISLLK